MKTTLLVLLSVTWAVGGLLRATERLFDLTTNQGETYKQCSIIKVTPEAVTVVHDGGVAKVDFKLLSDGWKEKYHYSPAKAEQYVKAEAEKRKVDAAVEKAAHDKWEREQEVRMAQMEKAEKQWLASLPSQIVSASLAPLPGEALVTDAVFDSEIPSYPPIQQVYTPNQDRVYRSGYAGSAGYYDDGYSYGYSYGYSPYYSYPLFSCYYGQGGHCPPSARPGTSGSPFRPPVAGMRNGGFSGRISSGGATFRIGR